MKKTAVWHWETLYCVIVGTSNGKWRCLVRNCINTWPVSGGGEGNGSPLQRSCLENPRDGGAWWAAVYGVAQSRTRLKRLSSSSSKVTLYCWVGILISYCYCDKLPDQVVQNSTKLSSYSFGNQKSKMCLPTLQSMHVSTRAAFSLESPRENSFPWQAFLAFWSLTASSKLAV